MKKRVLSLLLAVMMVFALCVSPAAAEQTGAQLNYVTDAAGLLSESQNAQLEIMAQAVSQKYGVGVYMVTLDDYRDYQPEGVFKATYTIYHDNTMGEGPNRDGIMLLLSMEDRDWAMFCYGSRCEYTFNSYGQKQLEEVFLDNFQENDWYGGFTDYVAECESYLETASVGKPVRSSNLFPILVAIALSLLLSVLIVSLIWNKMDNVAVKATAGSYISQDLQLTKKTDRFIRKTTHRQAIQRNSSGSSGGSKSESGGGGSGRSGKF